MVHFINNNQDIKLAISGQFDTSDGCIIDLRETEGFIIIKKSFRRISKNNRQH